MKKLYSHRRRKRPETQTSNRKKTCVNCMILPDPAADDCDTVPDTDSTGDSEDEFCMEVHGTEEWVWDYENSEEDNIQTDDGVATEPKDDDETKDDEDRSNRVVVSRVALTTAPKFGPR